MQNKVGWLALVEPVAGRAHCDVLTAFEKKIDVIRCTVQQNGVDNKGL